MTTTTYPDRPVGSIDPAIAVSTALPPRRVSWGAIVAGMVIAVGVQLVLSLLGVGIGMSTIDPLRYNSPDAATFGIGAAAWWAVSSVVALFAGGWVAGHLAGTHGKVNGALHGLLAWGLATIVTVYLLASAIGSVVRGGASVVGTAATVTAAGAAAAAGPATDLAKRQLEASGISVDGIKDQVRQLLAQTGKPALQADSIMGQASAAAGQMTSATANAGANGASAGDDLQAALRKIVESGKSSVDAVDRDAVVNVVTTRAGIPRAEAEQRVDSWLKTYQDARSKFDEQKAQAEVKAREVADSTARASSQAALGSVVALLLGALAAGWGGMLSRRDADTPATATASRHRGA